MYRKRLQKSLQQSLLDKPVPKLAFDTKSKRTKALPPPLVPTQYVTPQPVPKQRKQQPVELPRSITKRRDPSLESLINEISPYYEEKSKKILTNNYLTLEVMYLNY